MAQIICAHFDNHFPHFERRAFDWQGRRQKYLSQIHDGFSDRQQYDLLCQMLEGLGDSHTRIYWHQENEVFRSGQANVVRALDAAFARQSSVSEKAVFRGNWARSMKATIEPLLQTPLQTAANGRFRWGILEGDVGYLENDLINAFSSPGTSRAEEMELLESELDALIFALKDCKSILVDLSFNQGGYDPAAMMIASRFADRRRLAFLKTTGSDLETPQEFYVAPRGPLQFTKPVFVMTSQSTVSSGEILVLMLKAFPHVTHVGEPTRGCLSSFLNKWLPNGFHLTLSNEVYQTTSGEIPGGSRYHSRQGNHGI